MVLGDGDGHGALASSTLGRGVTDGVRVRCARWGRTFSTCPLCEAMCGLEIETEDERAVRVRAWTARRLEQGVPVPQGRRWASSHHDPDRLRAPMVRDGDEWREVTWDEAFASAARSSCAPVVAEHGIESVHAYLGNPNVHSYSPEPLRRCGPVGLGGIRTHLVGGHRRPVAQERGLRPALRRGVEHPDPRHRPHRPLRGDGRQPPRLERLAPRLPRRARRHRRHPRARRPHHRDRPPPHRAPPTGADEWLPVRPGTDAALLLAVVPGARRGGLDRPRAPRRSRPAGSTRSLLAALPYTPEAGGGVVRHRRRPHPRPGPRAGRRRAPGVYGRIGLCNQEFGTLASWLVEVVNILLGRLCTEGGALVPRPAIALISSQPCLRGRPAEDRPLAHPARCGAPEVLGQVAARPAWPRRSTRPARARSRR